jgi:8-oxo-dGTP pyrophosphatase MutT (NUDIX family)
VEVEERTAVRIILIDPDDRVLLFGARDPDDGRVVWVMPGGGIEPGETLEETAHRELLEETGIEVERLQGPVWTREHEFTWDGRAIRYRERFMVGRISEHREVERGGMGAEELRYHVGVRWMSLDQIRASSDLIAPRRLGELLPPILAGDLPREPIETGV